MKRFLSLLLSCFSLFEILAATTSSNDYCFLLDNADVKETMTTMAKSMQSGVPTTVEIKGDKFVTNPDTNTYPWTFDVSVTNADSKFANVNTFTASNSLYGTMLCLGSQSNPIKSFTLSTTAFKNKKIKEVSATLAITNDIASYDAISYYVLIGDKKFEFENTFITSSLPSTAQCNDTQGAKLSLVVENSNNEKVGLYFQKIEVIYEDGDVLADPVDPGLVLPISANIPWQKTITIGNNGQPLFSSDITADQLELQITPDFEIKRGPSADSESGSASENDEQNSIDGYYSFDATASFDNNDSPTAMTFKVPCSGLYTVTLKTKEGISGYEQSEISRQYSIYPYPADKKITVNWQTINTETSSPQELHTSKWGDRDWTNALVDIDCIDYTTYYKVTGDAAFARRRADTGSTDAMYTIDSSFAKYDAKGIDLTKGNTLYLQFEKNGSVSPVTYLNYTKQITTGVSTIEASEPMDTRYYDLTGKSITGTPTLPGIYIKRNGNQTEKIYIK